MVEIVEQDVIIVRARYSPLSDRDKVFVMLENKYGMHFRTRLAGPIPGEKDTGLIVIEVDKE